MKIGDTITLKAITRKGKNRLQHGNVFKIGLVSDNRPEGVPGTAPFVLVRHEKGSWFWFASSDDDHIIIDKG